MFGQEFRRVGSINHIQTRIGDGDGDPFNGQLKLAFNKKELVVISRSNIFATSPSICFVNQASKIIEKSYLSPSDYSKFDDGVPSSTIRTHSIDAQPTGICVSDYSNETTLVVADKNHCINFISLISNSITYSYGQFGAGSGEFCDPVAVDAFKADDSNLIFCVLETGGNQRIQFFDHNRNHLLLYGGMGHSKGRFLDATSLSSFSTLNNKRHGNVVPDFFKGCCSIDDLEEDLFNESFNGNFLMCCLDQSTLGREFHILHISSDDRKLHHIIIVRDPISGGFVFADEERTTTEEAKAGELLGGDRTARVDAAFTGVVDFLKAQSRYSFSLGADRRSYATVAVADRGNRRVQVVRMYWEKSDFYQPSAHIMFVLGDSHCTTIKSDRHMVFVDPVGVAYSNGGDLLAICDSGGGAASATGKIFILSGHSMELLRTVSAGFLSDSAIFRRKKERAMAAKTSALVATADSTADDPFDAIDNAESIAKTRTGSPRPNSHSDLHSDSSPPCSVAFSANGNLAVGYRNGGINVFEPAKTKIIGTLSKIQISAMRRIVTEYLSYADIQALRNCCIALHDFTKDLRLTWQVFPGPRRPYFNCAVSLFVHWATYNGDGHRLSAVFPLVDERGETVCKRYLNMQCGDRHCPKNHRDLFVDRLVLQNLGAYLEHRDFSYFVGVLFDCRFVWKYERYINALFEAFSTQRKAPPTRKKEIIGKKSRSPSKEAPVFVRVLSFNAYLEVITVLEEHYDGLKDIHTHNLFSPIVRKKKTSTTKTYNPYDLESIDKRVYIDSLEQYNKGIDVPFRNFKGITVVPLQGMEKVEKEMTSPVAEHVDLFDFHAGKATKLLNSLFS